VLVQVRSTDDLRRGPLIPPIRDVFRIWGEPGIGGRVVEPRLANGGLRAELELSHRRHRGAVYPLDLMSCRGSAGVDPLVEDLFVVVVLGKRPARGPPLVVRGLVEVTHIGESRRKFRLFPSQYQDGLMGSFSLKSGDRPRQGPTYKSVTHE